MCWWAAGQVELVKSSKVVVLGLGEIHVGSSTFSVVSLTIP
jgi:hypothetical protein